MAPTGGWSVLVLERQSEDSTLPRMIQAMDVPSNAQNESEKTAWVPELLLCECDIRPTGQTAVPTTLLVTLSHLFHYSVCGSLGEENSNCWSHTLAVQCTPTSWRLVHSPSASSHAQQGGVTARRFALPSLEEGWRGLSLVQMLEKELL